MNIRKTDKLSETIEIAKAEIDVLMETDEFFLSSEAGDALEQISNRLAEAISIIWGGK